MSLHSSIWRAVDLFHDLQNAGGNPHVALHCAAGDLHPNQTFGFLDAIAHSPLLPNLTMHYKLETIPR